MAIEQAKSTYTSGTEQENDIHASRFALEAITRGFTNTCRNIPPDRYIAAPDTAQDIEDSLKSILTKAAQTAQLLNSKDLLDDSQVAAIQRGLKFNLETFLQETQNRTLSMNRLHHTRLEFTIATLAQRGEIVVPAVSVSIRILESSLPDASVIHPLEITVTPLQPEETKKVATSSSQVITPLKIQITPDSQNHNALPVVTFVNSTHSPLELAFYLRALNVNSDDNFPESGDIDTLLEALRNKALLFIREVDKQMKLTTVPRIIPPQENWSSIRSAESAFVQSRSELVSNIIEELGGINVFQDLRIFYTIMETLELNSTIYFPEPEDTSKNIILYIGAAAYALTTLIADMYILNTEDTPAFSEKLLKLLFFLALTGLNGYIISQIISATKETED